ncbi:MAG: hybrid sensor histidine kinase/response regulator [Verrucomicrobia bacterium]|nr:hybrid sensor histidine kinase/response regulator [Verrucomicrobiota bacterium]MCH8511556.1 hybrid sensor histidine kinase/response regulator [Kiritimatiellia bacterium]
MTALPKILVIDDEIGTRESLKILLNKSNEVFCADSVPNGLDFLKAQHPDAVVMDIRMPGVDGIQGLRDLREIDPIVSVIMLTGYGTLETAREAIRLGANDYLKKPFDVVEMKEVIENNVRRTDFLRRRELAAKNILDLNARLLKERREKKNFIELGMASEELAHDLRSPLSVVMGCAELLANEIEAMQDILVIPDQSEQALAYLNVIEQSVKRCGELLDVWRTLGARTRIKMKACTLDALLQPFRNEAALLANPLGKRLEFNMQCDGLTVVNANETQFHRILMNLLNNALDAIREEPGGVISFTVRAEDKWVMMSMKDNGTGISPDHIQRIFDPDFTTKADGEGTGLGLYITRRLLQKHHGQISVTSEFGQGTEFTLKIPCHFEHRHSPGSASKAVSE